MVADGFPDVLNTGGFATLHRVAALHLTDVVKEVLHHVLAVFRQVYFRVKLHAINLQLVMRNTCQRKCRKVSCGKARNQD